MRANDPVRVLRRWHYAYATTLQVAHALGVSERTADAWLHILASEGKVKREPHGWRAVYKGAQEVREIARSG